MVKPGARKGASQTKTNFHNLDYRLITIATRTNNPILSPPTPPPHPPPLPVNSLLL